MKQKTPKPRVMWANIYEKGTAAFPTKEAAIEDDKKDAWPVALSVAVPVAVIPLDDIEAIVERAAKAMYVNARRCDGMAGPYTWETTFQCVRDAYLNDARAALTAAGIPCAKPTKQRRAKR